MYEIRLNNIGVGPALIESFEIFVDDKKIDGKGTEPIDRAINILFPTHTPTVLYRSYLAKGGALGEKEGIVVVSMQFMPQTLPTPEVLDHTLKRIKLVVRYKSIYEDKTYTYDSLANHQT